MSDFEYVDVVEKAKTRVSNRVIPSTYKTRKGDSLWKIAHKFYEDGDRWVDIYNLNSEAIGGNPLNLKTGTVLNLPE